MPLPKDKLARVIVNTDAKNEADDQYCIVQALLSPSFELAGLIPAHFGTRRNTRSMEESREEIDLLLKLMNLTGKVTVANGAPTALPDEKTPVPSEGAELIIREAMKDDDRPLHVAFLGPLTDMASALLMEPKIAKRNVRVVWIGGGRWPVGGSEFNLSNDIHAANVVFRSSVELWQLPMTIYQMIAVSYAELEERVRPHGPLGAYLVDQLIEFNSQFHAGPIEYRSLGDTPSLSVIMNPNGGTWRYEPAPEFSPLMNYIHTGRNRPVRVYDTIDVRFILEDMFAKIARHARGVQETAVFV